MAVVPAPSVKLLPTGMLNLRLGVPNNSRYKVLCLGAHCDDIEIGCGGTILRLIKENPKTEFRWVVFSSNPVRKREAAKCARAFLESAARSRIEIRTFRDSFFPYQGKAIKESVESIKRGFQPDLIFTHYRHDLHQDHRLISELTWNAFRNLFILEYEIPKYDGDLGSPNFFVALDDAICRRKIANILGAFRSQAGKQWFSEDTFRALLRIRGMESNVEQKFAEGFHCRKAVL
jgi:LmbE family N-acetylglucosaminyl deacetylase